MSCDVCWKLPSIGGVYFKCRLSIYLYVLCRQSFSDSVLLLEFVLNGLNTTACKVLFEESERADRLERFVAKITF